MFKPTEATQVDLFKNFSLHYSERKLKILNDPTRWHNVFYQQVFCRIDESVFKPLYCLDNGRANASIKILVAMMILKEGQGWSDKQLFLECEFNALVMVALGMYNADQDIPAESTYYEFRKKLLAYYKSEEIDLLDKAFENVTIEQMDEFGVYGGKIRMDSKLINSNIARSSRLALILGVIQKFIKNKKLNELVKAKLNNKQYAFLVKLQSEKVGKICYGLNKAEEKILLIELGKTITVLLNSYNKQVSDYDVLERLFGEQYELVDAEQASQSSDKGVDERSVKQPSDQQEGAVVELEASADTTTNVASCWGESSSIPKEKKGVKTGGNKAEPTDKQVDETAQTPKASNKKIIRPKAGKTIAASSIQSAHDTQAAHRSKGQGVFKQQKDGYHSNIVETCDEADDLNLISKVTTKPADKCEAEFMIEDMETTESMLQAAHQPVDEGKRFIKQNITDGGFDGKENRIYMAREDSPEWILAKTKGGKPIFTMQYDNENEFQVYDISSGEVLKTSRSQDGKKVVVHKTDGTKRYFTDEAIVQYILRQQYNDPIDDVSKGLRANCESTIHQVFHRLGKRDKIKYRGLLKCHMYVLCRAFWVNCSRIQQKLAKTNKKATQNTIILLNLLLWHFWKLDIGPAQLQNKYSTLRCSASG